MAKTEKPRSEAQKRAWAKYLRLYQPHPHIDEAGTPFVDADLVGKQLVSTKLGIAMEYLHSFYATDGMMHAGTICSKAPGVGFALGDVWCARAEELVVRGGTE